MLRQPGTSVRSRGDCTERAGALSKGDGPNADGLVDRGGAHRAA